MIKINFKFNIKFEINFSFSLLQLFMSNINYLQIPNHNLYVYIL